MNLNMFSRWITLPLLAALAVISCGAPVSVTSPPEPSEPGNTQAAPSTPTVEINEETPSGSDPSCNVLQDLNLRFGPGTAYRPPVRVLPANSVVTPLGFAPQGIPGGRWAYVQDSATQDEGWVSAGAQYISCNIQLANLPSVAFGTPPPPPLPKSAQSSDPDGNGFCVDPDSEYKCVATFSDESLFQFQIIRNGIELGENDGVEPVEFTITKDGDLIYSTTENTVSYCIFGGNGPCNRWVIEDGIYKWTAGGTPVEPGEYKVGVNLFVNGEDSHWEVNFTLALP